MGINLLSIAKIQASVQNQRLANRPYSVYWTDNGDLKDWNIFVNMDIVGAWNGFLFGTKRTASDGFIGPVDAFPPVDALVNDHIFFRMRYDKHPRNQNAVSFGKIQWVTTADPIFNDEKSLTFPIEPDVGFRLYEIDMNVSSKWTGLITNVRFFPCEDGARNDEFFISFFEIGTLEVDFQLENDDAGTPGKVIGGAALTTDITITKNVNDSLLVNIDNYGFVEVHLTPQTASPIVIARDLAIQLSKLAVGGYMRAFASVDLETKQLIIESGTRAANSSVQIQFGENSAAFALGLTNIDGTFIGTAQGGTDPSPDYISISEYRPTTFELLNFLDNSDDSVSVVLDPDLSVLEGGRRDFGTISRNIQTSQTTTDSIGLEGTRTFINGTIGDPGKTFIDLNHPFTDDGKLISVAFNGIADEDGGSKWKVFRPQQNGTLLLIAEGVIGQRNFTEDPDGGLVLTRSPGAYVEDLSQLNVRVRRGDLLGLFNVSMHLGTGRLSKPDALYYEISGDAQGTITTPVPQGAGSGGIPVYARGSASRRQMVLDIDFQRRINLDTLTILGEEASNDLEYNVARATSANLSVDVSGEHTICRIVFLDFRECFQRNNQAFNVQALNDGIRLADNGLSSFGDGGAGGIGGADVDGATYMYINGDGEFLDSFDFDPTLQPALYGFDRDPFGITCFFSSSSPRLDKPISKAIMYFKDSKNMRSWQIETARGQGEAGGNGSINGFELIPEESMLAIEFDDKRVEIGGPLVFSQKDTGTQTLLAGNPVILDVIANDGTRNPQIGVDFQQDVSELGGANFAEQATYLNTQWTKFQWEFEPIRTTGFRWFCDYHYSSKISEIEIYASAPAKESLGDNIQVLFSADGENFYSADIINATNTSAEFQLGNSPRYMRLIFRPSQTLFLKNLLLNFEQDQIYFGEEGRILNSTPVDAAPVGSLGPIKTIPVINNTGVSADLLVDIPVDAGPSKELIYFNHLNQETEITFPEIGGPGTISFDEDRTLRETENVAINAKAYGLKNLTSLRPLETFTPELLVNGGFETGDLTGWNLKLTQSGSLPFQIPRVYDIETPGSSDFDPTVFTQTGDFLFGFNMDSRILEQGGSFAPVVFDLETEPIDLTSFASNIDLGAAEAMISFTYAAAFNPSDESPRLIVLGSPDAVGLEEPVGTTLSPEYGLNTLRDYYLGQSNRSLIDTANDVITISNLASSVKEGTRFIKFIFRVNAQTFRTLSTFENQTFFLDTVSAKVRLVNEGAVRWYKSWRTGAGDFTDASFKAITDLTATVGSSHWYQPFLLSANAGVPIAGQTQGFSNAFTNDRFLGIQSFSRMTLTNPGLLGCQWTGEKLLTGFRVGFSHANTSSSFAWPRHWFVQVLRPQSELGEDPDINNPAHFTTVINYTQTGPWANTAGDRVNNDSQALVRSPDTIITTWLFNTPVNTEGIRLVFTTNCDKFEKDIYGAGTIVGAQFAAFEADTTCPTNAPSVGNTFSSNFGLSLTFFQPLESVGTARLPIDNVKETVQPNSNIFAGLDLRRPFAIDTNSKVFELIADAFENSSWLSSSVVFSSTDTDDPNAVVWGNTSSSFARWLRFQSPAVERYEDPVSLNGGALTTIQIPAVIKIPQGILRSARVYPDITVPSLHTIGFNCEWEPLEEIITDNSNTTFVNYSDFPILAIDLADEFFLASSETAFRAIHDLIAGRPGTLTDTTYWKPRTNANFTYSSASFRGADNPQVVKFLSFGSAAPSTSLRWVALRGDAPLRPGAAVPRVYNFNSPGGKLFNSFWRPAVEDPITDHPSWFRTKKTGLNDVSTFDTTLGNTFTAVEGVDYGANITTQGSSFYPFDGQFSLLTGDMWTVFVRDINGVSDPDSDFPHIIHRVFRDSFTFELQPKTITAFKILGYNEQIYPTSFTIERLSEQAASDLNNALDADSVAADRALLADDGSWSSIFGGDFTDVDTFADGEGFLAILDSPITAAGFRIVITESAYPDDSDLTEINDAGGFSTAVDVSGPQTRVVELVFYEEGLVESVLEGQIDINHCVSAQISASDSLGENPIQNINDENISTFWQSASTNATITITLAASRPISRLEWEKDPNLGRSSGTLSTNAPSDFVLKAILPGGSEQMVVSQTGFIGNSFSVDLFGAPVNTDKFILEISSAQGENEGANSLQISELRLIEEFIQTTPLVVVDRILETPEGNGTSTRITYAPNTDAPAEVYVDGMDAGSDLLFSERDFFDFNFDINDVNLLDLNFGHFKIGNSPDIAYRWDFKDIPGLASGWNRLRLQFKTASDRAVVPVRGGPLFSLSGDSSQVDFTTEDAEFTSAVDGVVSQRIIQAPGIRFFEIRFRGNKSVADSPLVLAINDFKFTRNKFEDSGKFGSALYLNNSEVLQLNVENIDISLGTVEFWLQPDWNTAGIVPSRGRVIPSLFRITQTDGKFLCFFYRPGTGFTLMVYDGQSLRQFETQFGAYSFNRYDNLHLAVIWDSQARTGKEKTSVQILVNGQVVFGSRVTWDAVRQGRGHFMVGGELSQSQTANPFNSTALAFTTVPTLPARHTASTWGLIQNLKVFNYAKLDFSDRNDFDIERTNLITANELIQVSMNGVDFETVGSPNLPLVSPGVAPGESTNIYVRTNIPKNLTGEENRDASLLVTWKAPKSTQCD